MKNKPSENFIFTEVCLPKELWWMIEQEMNSRNLDFSQWSEAAFRNFMEKESIEEPETLPAEGDRS